MLDNVKNINKYWFYNQDNTQYFDNDMLKWYTSKNILKYPQRQQKSNLFTNYER